MKKFYFLMTAAALMMALAACSGNKKAESASKTSDSALTEQMESPVAGDTAFYLTREGIGPVHTGESVSALPAAVPNLYDHMLTTDTPDAMAYTFLLADVPQFTIYDFMAGKVDVIALEGNARGVQTPRGEIRVGDEFSKVLALDGSESEWESYDDGGIWYWRWNGLYFGVDETNISDKLADALCNENTPPSAALFTPAVKIGYIATGLPF